jgi:hypothetical protein
MKNVKPLLITDAGSHMTGLKIGKGIVKLILEQL